MPKKKSAVEVLSELATNQLTLKFFGLADEKHPFRVEIFGPDEKLILSNDVQTTEEMRRFFFRVKPELEWFFDLPQKKKPKIVLHSSLGRWRDGFLPAFSQGLFQE